MKRFQIKSTEDIEEFLVALKKSISKNHLGRLAYERSDADKLGRYKGYVYYGTFTGHRRLMPQGDHDYGTIGFHTSENDIGFAFALDGRGEVDRSNVGKHTYSPFKCYSWTDTAQTLIRQIQVFSRREKSMMEKITRRISPEGISSLSAIRF